MDKAHSGWRRQLRADYQRVARNENTSLPPMNELDAIRRRPGMYVGDTHDGSGLRHMVWEAVANALDEHLAGRCTRISVEIGADGSLTVEDNGRGMPLHEVEGVTFAERALTSFHRTPTMDGHAPHEHLGLKGVGIFVVCALSRQFELHIYRDGVHFVQRFQRGVACSKLENHGTSVQTGTRVTFVPDCEIFTDTWVDPGPIVTRLRELSFLLPKLSFHFRDLRQHVFHEPNGLLAYVEAASPKAPLTTFTASGEVWKINVEVVARWADHPWSRIESFANVERTTDGGTHVRGLLLGLAIGLKQAIPQVCANKTSKQLQQFISHGLTAAVRVRLNDPTYDSPTKSRLATPEARAAVKACVTAAFRAFIESESSAATFFAARMANGEQTQV